MKFIKVASVSPKLKVCDTDFNTVEIVRILKELSEKNVSLAVFPELSVSGYTCGDIFLQDRLLDKTLSSLNELKEASKTLKTVFAVGAPLRNESKLYNCAVLIGNGEYLGVVPKEYIPNYNEFYEGRWFKKWDPTDRDTISINDDVVPFGQFVFSSNSVNVGIEICEDMWAVNMPSNSSSLSGAEVILNLSASNELVAKSSYRRSLVSIQSGKLLSGYVYASCGVNESTTDVVYSGHLMISDLGTIIKENKRFSIDSEYIVSWIDVDRIRNERMRNTTFRDSKPMRKLPLVPIDIFESDINEFDRQVNPHPFIPDESEMTERCTEIFNIQAHALASRLRAIGLHKLVLGISGGLDSTLALLVSIKALKLNGFGPENIITVTMPGFGTTDRTYVNAVNLMKEIGTDFREINIREATLLHFKDIGHDENIHDSTYENTQARERTQILMDIANKESAIVVGTGDLSELALGWATYNGDHMSMYGVNASIPKTLVRYLTRYAALNESTDKVREILLDVLDTPVSPELLPHSKEGKIVQKTEDIIGPYELHDFFLFHMLRYGAPPEKILFLANHAFKGVYDEETILKWLKVFIKRFFTNQFKRSALPDGPKVGSISLSPRGDLKMPSDASYMSFINV